MAKKPCGKPIGDTPRCPSQPTLKDPGKMVDHNVASTNPNSKQFEPTEANLTPQRYNMAGGNN